MDEAQLTALNVMVDAALAASALVAAGTGNTSMYIAAVVTQATMAKAAIDAAILVLQEQD